jgi:GAF domain-containing protein
VVQAVPECVAISISHFEGDLTLTLVTTSDELRVLNAAQYLDSGPRESAAIDGDEIDIGDVPDEDRWQLSLWLVPLQVSAVPCRLPLLRGDTVYGSVNFYASTDHAFIARERDLAVMFGAQVEAAVANADLSMSSPARARQGQGVRDQGQAEVGEGVFNQGRPVPEDV